MIKKATTSTKSMRVVCSNCPFSLVRDLEAMLLKSKDVLTNNDHYPSSMLIFRQSY